MTSLVAAALSFWIILPDYAGHVTGPALCLAFVTWALLHLGGIQGVAARRAVAAASGVAGTALFIVSVPAFLLSLVPLAVRLLLRRASAVERVLLLLPVLLVGLLFIVVALVTESGGHEFVHALRIALPDAGALPVVLVEVAAASCLVTGVASAAEVGTSRSTVARGVLIAAAVAVLGSRALDSLPVAWVAKDCRIWCESALMLDLDKWRAGVPVFGPLEDVNSYVYSPLIVLIGWAVLAPFGASSSVVAHRFVMLGLEAATVAVLVLVVLRSRHEPSSRRIAAVCVAIAALGLLWSNDVTPYVHPDHAMNAVAAGAAALIIARDRVPHAVRLVALFTLPILGTAFKLTGAGIGVGLFALAVLARSRLEVAVLIGSGVASLATLPLFNHLFGAYTRYALELVRRHPTHPERVYLALTLPWGRLFVASAIAVLCLGNRRGVSGASRPVLLLAATMALFATMAFVKAGGQTNNLVTPTLLAATALMLALLDGNAVAAGLALPAFAALVVAVLPAAPVLHAPQRAELRADFEAATIHVEDALRRGRNPLVAASSVVWRAAGGKGIPRDQYFSMLELILADEPGVDGYFARLASGRYTSIVTRGAALAAPPGLEQHSGELMRRAVGDRYCMIYPAGPDGNAVPLDYGRGMVILQRRDLGCTVLR